MIKLKTILFSIIYFIALLLAIGFYGNFKNKPSLDESEINSAEIIENKKIERKIRESMTLKGIPTIYDPQVKVVVDDILLIWPNKPGDYTITNTTDILRFPKSCFKKDRFGSTKVYLYGLDQLYDVNIRMQLPYMKPWNPLPPLSLAERDELANELRMLNTSKWLFPKWLFLWNDKQIEAIKARPTSLDDPKLSEFLENRNQYRRHNLVLTVRRGLNNSPISINIPEKTPDGIVDGLNRYSQVKCLKDLLEAPTTADSEYVKKYRIKANEYFRKILANKPSDDPAPEGCWVDRLNSTYFSSSKIKHDEKLSIECDPFDFMCKVEFRRGNFHIQFDMSGYDIPIYQTILKPIKEELDKYIYYPVL
jgi:hypothetical protein